MDKLPVPPDVLAKLAEVGYPAEICDPAGERVAVVLPPVFFREMFDFWCDHVFGPPGPPATQAEIAGGMTTPEAIAYLRALVEKHRGAA